MKTFSEPVASQNISDIFYIRSLIRGFRFGPSSEVKWTHQSYRQLQRILTYKAKGGVRWHFRIDDSAIWRSRSTYLGIGHIGIECGGLLLARRTYVGA